MPSISAPLAQGLRQTLQLARAVETGTWRGDGAARLARLFPEVVTIELSPHFYSSASMRLAPLGNVNVLQGHSVERLPELVHAGVPTLWFLDGHWSAADTAGVEDECPVLREIAVLRGGHPDDVIVVDDARYFTAAPPPPHLPEKWPTLLELIDALRAVHPGHHITLLNDQVIAAPPRARRTLDSYGQSLLPTPTIRTRALQKAATIASRVANKVRPHRTP